jgi:hypothetical protein
MTTAPEPHAGTDDLEGTWQDGHPARSGGPGVPSQSELWAAQNAPGIASAAGCTDAEYERLLSDRQQAEAAYLGRWGSLAPEPRTEAELAAAARAEAWGPQSPVPYLLTPAAEAALDSPEIYVAFSRADEAYGRTPGTAARLLAGEEITDPEAAEVLDEWDSADSAAYMDRVEAGLEPEAEL